MTKAKIYHWAINISGWGTLFAIGTEEQAEEWATYKSQWENAVGRLRLATVVEMRCEKFEILADILGE